MSEERKKFEEAYRSVHNLYAQYQGLGTLKDVLKHTLTLDDHILAEEEKLKEARKVNADLKSSVAATQIKLTNIGKEYQEKATALQNTVTEEIDALILKRDQEDKKLTAFLHDNQVRVNKVKEDTMRLESDFKNRAAELEKGISALVDQKIKQESALASSRKKLQALIGDDSNG